MKSFAVLGLGRFGSRMALKLAEEGAEVLAIDRDRKCVDQVADGVTRAAMANVRDRDALEELGVAECDCAILAIGGDLAASVLGVMNLKAIGAKQVICKAYDETHRDVLYKLGADRVVIPEQEFADKLSQQLVSPQVKDFLSLGDGYSVEEIAAPGSWFGRSLGDIRVRSRYDATVLAVIRPGAPTLSPDGAETIREGDSLILFGDRKTLDAIRRLR